MTVRNCCLGCQGPLPGPCGSGAGRLEAGTGPCCVHTIWSTCSGPCGQFGVVHGARGGAAGSFFSCGHGCIGGCTSGLCSTCCGPSCS